MPTYKQTRTFYEGDYGAVTEVIVASDTYAGMTDLSAAIEVGVIYVEATQEDLNDSAGTFAVSEMEFNVLPELARTTDDVDCVAFLLDARVPGTKRFIGRMRNAGDPIVNADFDHLGVVFTDVTGDWIEVSGPEWSTTLTPLWAWKMRAQSFDARVALGAKMKEIVAAIDSSWFAANVADRLGYFYESAAGHTYEGRYCNLVAFQVLLQELLDRAAPDGITLTYEAAELDPWVRPSHWQVYRATNGRWVRYSAKYFDDIITKGPAPYKVILDDNVWKLKAGGDADSDQSLWVSSRLITPTQEGQSYSWLRYDTLGDLLYALASAFGCYVQFIYDSTSAIRVRFGARSELNGGPVYIRDYTKGSITSKAVNPETDSKRFIGASWQISNEGDTMYNYDGGSPFAAREQDKAPSGGELLPVTISPTFCFLQNRGFDLGVDMSDEPSGSGMIPHNAAHWHNGSRQGPQVPENITESDHTGLYMRLAGRSDDGTHGCDGRTVWMPLGYMHYDLDGVTYGTDKLSEYLNAIYQRDDAYFDDELTIEVPYVCGFRATPDGPADWRHLQLGKRVTIDGEQWTVVSIRRQTWPQIVTQIKLHRSSRFVLEIPDTTVGTELGGNNPVFGKPSFLGRQVVMGIDQAAEAIMPGDLVALRSDGKVYRAVAYHSEFGHIIGVSLYGGEAGDYIDVQRVGRVTLPDSFSLTAGERVYLRTAIDDGPNISQSRLFAKTDTEDLFLDFGIAESSNIITIDWRRQFVFDPPIPDEEL